MDGSRRWTVTQRRHCQEIQDLDHSRDCDRQGSARSTDGKSKMILTKAQWSFAAGAQFGILVVMAVATFNGGMPVPNWISCLSAVGLLLLCSAMARASGPITAPTDPASANDQVNQI